MAYTLTSVFKARRSAVVERIAATVLSIRQLDEQHSDRLDFHEVSVCSVREALDAAYLAGFEHGKDSK